MSDQENKNASDEENLDQQANQDALESSEAALQTELDELQTQYQEMSNAFLRAKAEVENIRKRAQEEEAKARKFAVEGFSKSLLAVKDSLEAAIGAANQTTETIKEGVETTLKQLNSVFEDNKLREIAPTIGDKFDPNLHQAIAAVPNTEHAPNSVIEVLQKGCTLHDRVLRPAMVMVSSAE